MTPNSTTIERRKVLRQKLFDITAQFGEDPDIDEVDEYVRSVLHQVLNELAIKHRFPILR